MIIGKKDKDKIISLEEKNKELEREKNKLKNSILEDMLKSDIMQLLKAIIKNFDNQEIKISMKEIEAAHRYDLYVQDEYLEHAKRYILIDRYKGMNNI